MENKALYLTVCELGLVAVNDQIAAAEAQKVARKATNKANRSKKALVDLLKENAAAIRPEVQEGKAPIVTVQEVYNTHDLYYSMKDGEIEFKILSHTHKKQVNTRRLK